MHFSTALAAILSGASLASAHFSVIYPWWRGDSFKTQWTYPCGGVNQSISNNNRTLWPLDGGAIVFHGSHPWAQTYVNMGLGNNVTSLKVPLVPPFNQTGKGTFCFPHVHIPDEVKPNITEGGNATLQVIQLSTTGGALYNCMDITFSSKAKNPESNVCFNSTGVGAANLDYPDVVPEPKTTTTAGADTLKSSMGAMAAVVAAGMAVLFA
ncbi:hypothetical protein L211DRAFT_861186 [Terfezia boudieri ATCC MYA-4762]|uniref:Copper acquisition factor BIM1-like domain-containing protein n=1 Tax=Terfezia boudieri ATCC MYA-4762 TaxID=1051890 RepID=A0A3N4LWD4_9PEZI|nr:hypothetical protein L211DRAFT_861186 [Terfezia boudieri ATCC MYA-4762]